MHPKVKAGARSAGLVAVIVAALSLFGVHPDSTAQANLGIILAAIIPVVAGYIQRSTE
jgi:hypothetical protein